MPSQGFLLRCTHLNDRLTPATRARVDALSDGILGSQSRILRQLYGEALVHTHAAADLSSRYLGLLLEWCVPPSAAPGGVKPAASQGRGIEEASWGPAVAALETLLDLLEASTPSDLRLVLKSVLDQAVEDLPPGNEVLRLGEIVNAQVAPRSTADAVLLELEGFEVGVVTAGTVAVSKVIALTEQESEGLQGSPLSRPLKAYREARAQVAEAIQDARLRLSGGEISKFAQDRPAHVASALRWSTLLQGLERGRVRPPSAH